MGVDIHMSVIGKDGEMKYSEIFDGRNTEWFDNITKNYHNDFYQNYPVRYELPEKVPEVIKNDHDDPDSCYYDFFHINVGDFLEWFEEARPDIDAGWVCTYDKWLYENKKIVPELNRWLDEDANPYDYQFIEVENPWDCSKWLYEYINEHEDITVDDFIVYYFDC